jgi:hypothetical protein
LGWCGGCGLGFLWVDWFVVWGCGGLVVLGRGVVRSPFPDSYRHLHFELPGLLVPDCRRGLVSFSNHLSETHLPDAARHLRKFRGYRFPVPNLQ